MTATERRAEREIVDYVLVVWRQRWLVVAGTAACVIVAFVLSLVQPKQYRASGVLLVSESKVPITDTGDAAPPGRSRLYADTYAELIRNRATAAEVVRTLGLEREPYRFKADDLVKRVTVRPVPSTALLQVSLDFPDRALAARMVNLLLEKTVTLSHTLSSGDLTGAREYLEQQVGDARAALEAADKKLRAYRSTARVEETKKRLEIVLGQAETLESARNDTALDIAALTASVRSMEDSLKSQQSVVTLSKSLANDPAFKDVIQGKAATSGDGLLGLRMQSEEVNPTYAQTQPDYVRQASDLAGLRARRGAVAAAIKANAAEAERLQREVAEKELTLAALQRDYTVATSAYESFSKRFETARLSVAAQSAALTIVDPAVPSDVPVSPHPLFNAILAAIAGGIAISFLVLLLERLRAVTAARAASADERRPGRADELDLVSAPAHGRERERL